MGTPTRFISTCLWGQAGSLGRKLTSSFRLLTLSSHIQPVLTTCKRTMSYSAVERGSQYTLDYRVFFKNSNGVAISPFHDIPLVVDEEKGIFNMVVEIPRWTNAKMEISKSDPLNPIKQDVKKGNLRFVKNIFPHKGYIWNYGALPQTYEDPEHVTEDTGAKGDADPLDVCEIGFKVHERGSVIQVKALGVMCLIDEGETDWKVLAIDVTDPLADKINDVSDIEENFPGLIKATYEWFRYYKVPDGKPENNFAFNGAAKDRAYTLNVIHETHGQWKKLVTESGESEMSRQNTSVKESPFLLNEEEANQIIEKAEPYAPSTPLSQEVNKWYHEIPQ